MLMYGKGNCIPITKDTLKVMNLTGMIQGYESIQILIPPNYLGSVGSREFDINYYNFIFSQPGVFIEFFRIIQTLYAGNDVYIISDEADWCEDLVESLMKIIQQRYGYANVHITSQEDYDYAVLYLDEPEFDPFFGLQNLDADKSQYQTMVTQIATKASTEMGGSEEEIDARIERMKLRYE